MEDPIRMRSSRKLELTDEAESDVRTLLRYTNANWGAAQRDADAGRLMGALGELVVHPHLGLARDEIAAGLRILRVGQHVAYYRVLEQSIRVERILHVSTDPSRHLRDHP